MKIQCFTLIFGASLAFAGCGSKDDDSSSSSSALEGVWKSGCVHEESTQGSTTSKSTVDRTFTFSGASLLVESISYDSEAKTCDTATSKTKTSGTFTIGADVTGVAGAKQLDIKIASILDTPLTEAEAKSNNDSKFCDATDSKINVEKDITKCAGQAEVFDIFKIDGTALTFGTDDETNDGSTAAKRPTALSTTEKYTKS